MKYFDELKFSEISKITDMNINTIKSIYYSVEKIIKEIKPDVVIHMAAVGDITVARDNPKYTYETSSNSTLNLLEAIRLHCPNSLFLSHTTDKVYGNNITPFDEQMKFDPSHIYSAAKVSQEHLTRIYAESYGVRKTRLSRDLLNRLSFSASTSDLFMRYKKIKFN